ncbi:MAG: 50S ribosomal protein L29 [Patescibacteria group bacterium]|nr:50S ribosomal protein L29 [Patescibacteria group bacterium]MCL5093975.1 50S ribosomal protein L29 [Patescibacteria group bacterium]
MKIKDILDKKDDVLKKEVEDKKKKLQESRFKVAVREEKNVRSLREVKRDIARIETILREREIEALESQNAKVKNLPKDIGTPNPRFKLKSSFGENDK